MTTSQATLGEKLRFSMHAGLELKAMKVGMGMMKMRTPKVLRGKSAVAQLADHIQQSQLHKVLIVTTPGSIKRGYVEKLATALSNHNIGHAIYDGVTPDPTYQEVRDGLAICHDQRCDCVVALGGGSVLDASKAIIVAATNKKPVEKLMGIRKGRNKPLPFFAIPTTSGTASEVTQAAVVSEDETHFKRFLVDTRTIAKVAVLDPSLSATLPPGITVETGMDALTHAVESYISRLSTPESEAVAKQSIADIFKHLPIVYQDGNNLESRLAMAEASMNAGIAFRTSLLGYVHAISHQLGAFYGVPHGLGNAMVLPHVLTYSKDVVALKLAQLALLLNLGKPAMTEPELAQCFIDSIAQFNSTLQVPTTLDALKAEDIPKLANRAYEEAIDMHAGPKYMGRRDIEVLLEKLL